MIEKHAYWLGLVAHLEACVTDTPVQPYSYVEIDHETFSTLQLSVTGKRMCTGYWLIAL